jgi:coenzyme Q-binding protein COQ10
LAVHRVSKILPYTPDELFMLVSDVARYPDFVPWINSMRTWGGKVDEAGVNTVDAEAGVGFSFLREKFATRVKSDPGARTVEVRLISGPFKKLVNDWTFKPHPQGTEIEFSIDFEFKSMLLTAMLNANFDRAVNKLIGCFEARARKLYGAVKPTA